MKYALPCSRIAIAGALALTVVWTTGCRSQQSEQDSAAAASSAPGQAGAGGGPSRSALNTYHQAIPSGTGHQAPPGSAMPPGGPHIPTTP